MLLKKLTTTSFIDLLRDYKGKGCLISCNDLLENNYVKEFEKNTIEDCLSLSDDACKIIYFQDDYIKLINIYNNKYKYIILLK